MDKKYDFQSRVAEYKKLVAAAAAHEGALPSLARYRVALEKAVDEIVATKNRQLNLEALRLKATEDLWGDLGVGREMAARLQGFVKASLDRDDERLADFGVKIKTASASRRRKKKGGNGSPGYHYGGCP
jgi:hypothetical protein